MKPTEVKKGLCITKYVKIVMLQIERKNRPLMQDDAFL
jgi:hypothetical protein